MTERQDPELVALGAVLRALGDLDREAQKRILEYATEKLLRFHPDLDITAFMGNLNKAFAAINETANKLNEQGPEEVSGLQLVKVVAHMYETAAQARSGATQEQARP